MRTDQEKARSTSDVIERTADFERIVSLRRVYNTDIEGEELAAKLTELLKKPAGTMILKPVQAMALRDIGTIGGILGPIRVGGGKTLISLLAPYILEARNPLLLLPAGLIDKTRVEMGKLMKHWRIPSNIYLQSYEAMGRVSCEKFLDFHRPDVIIADEAHKLKNKRAGVTRRVSRYLTQKADTKFIAISGTLMKNGLKDFGHLSAWALKEGSPLPLKDEETERWAQAIDDKKSATRRPQVGVLIDLLPHQDTIGKTPIEAARMAVKRRILESPGVIMTKGEDVSCSIILEPLGFSVSAKTQANYEKLRTEWETPDGFALSEAVAVWRASRELVLGLHYIWDPPAPEDWRMARKEWAAFVRGVIGRSHSLDTELAVANAVDRREVKSEKGELQRWREIKPSFQVNSKPVWHDESALEVCAKWMKEQKGIVWCEHTFFAEALSKSTGVPYYGPKGQNYKGEAIENAPTNKPLIASVAANSTGRNLQAWKTNLVTSPATSPVVWEQLIGRTHRMGQRADEVLVNVLHGCHEHADSLERAIAAAKLTEETLGQPQKLLLSDLVPYTGKKEGWAWRPNKNVVG